MRRRSPPRFPRTMKHLLSSSDRALAGFGLSGASDSLQPKRALIRCAKGEDRSCTHECATAIFALCTHSLRKGRRSQLHTRVCTRVRCVRSACSQVTMLPGSFYVLEFHCPKIPLCRVRCVASACSQVTIVHACSVCSFFVLRSRVSIKQALANPCHLSSRSVTLLTRQKSLIPSASSLPPVARFLCSWRPRRQTLAPKRLRILILVFHRR